MSEENYPLISVEHRILGDRARPRSSSLDARSVDFMCKSNTIKSLFALPYSDQGATFALHKVENLLLIEQMNSSGGDIDIFFDDHPHLPSYEESRSSFSSLSGHNRSAPFQSGLSNLLDLFDSIDGGSIHSLLPSISNFESGSSLGVSTTSSTFDTLMDKADSEYNALSSSLFSQPLQNFLHHPWSASDQGQPSLNAHRQLAPKAASSIDSFITEVEPLPSTRPDQTPAIDMLPTSESHAVSSVPEEPDSSPVPPADWRPTASSEQSIVAISRKFDLLTVHNMSVALTDDTIIYNTAEHPAFSLKCVDSSSGLDFSDCLDLYLDNVIANVPELAVALHARGYVRGVRFIPTDQIPNIESVFAEECAANASFSSATSAAVSKSSLSSEALLGNPLSRPDLVTSLVLASKKQDSRSSAHSWRERIPPKMFDPKVIDMDATTIMRFLKENCTNNNGTYILRRAPGSQDLRLFELDELCRSKQKQFMWMLAMLSYRFALQLKTAIQSAKPASRLMLRNRQIALFTTCNDMLEQINKAGGEDHGTIRAAVLEHMADIHIARVDDFNIRHNRPHSVFDAESRRDSAVGEDSLPASSSREGGAAGERSSKCLDANEDDDYDESAELTDASDLLCRSVLCLEVTIRNEISSFEAPSSLGEDEDEEDNQFIIKTLALQLAGLMRKLIHTSTVTVVGYLRGAKIVDSVSVLHCLLPSCKLWTDLRQSLANSQRHLSPGAAAESGLAGADATITHCLPLLWNLVGETCREVTKQTGGISLEDAELRNKLDRIISTFHALSHSVLAKATEDEHRHSSDGAASKTKPTSKAKAKSKQKKQKSNQNQKMAKRDWTVFAGLFQLCDIAPERVSALSVEAKAPKNIALKALRMLHSIVAPVALFGAPLSLQPCLQYAPPNLFKPCASVDILSEVEPIALHMDDDVRIMFVLVHCFLSTVLLNNQKAYNAMLSLQEQALKVSQSSNLSARLRAGGSPCVDPITPKDTGGFIRFEDNKVREGLRRVADSCNVLGQKLLTLALLKINDAPPCALNESATLLLTLAEQIFTVGILSFQTAGDYVNAATVRCNLCSLIRNQVSALMRLDHGPMQIDTVPIALASLRDVVQHCHLAHSMLSSKQLPVWDSVSLESGHANLLIGVLNRDKMLAEGARFDAGKSVVSEEALVTVPLGEALKIFTLLRNERHSAAASYHLGSYYSRSWALLSDPDEVSNCLENALLHYQEAHKYYSRFDVGPTLVRILLDMCDLYLASYAASEESLLQLSLVKKTMTSSGGRPADWQPSAAGELVVALLGGALQALLDCRFAFTAAVVERHRMKMVQLSTDLSNRLSKVLFKVFKAQSREQLPPPVADWIDSDGGRSSLQVEASIVIDSMKELKTMYSQLIRKTDASQSGPASPPGGDLDASNTASVYDMLCRLQKNQYLKQAFAPQPSTPQAEI